MKYRLTLSGLLLLFTISSIAQIKSTEIFILGSDHLAQIYNAKNSNTDVLLPRKQAEIMAFTKMVLAYKPDVIAVEVLPEKQNEIDSLYALYFNNKIKLEDLPDGRSEVYQLAFRMAKQLKLQRVYCVNAPGGTSQSILDNGNNIELYKEEGIALRNIVVEKMSALQKGTLSLKDYLVFLNQPATIKKVYHLKYITPARVTYGKFKNPDEMVDTAFINPKYIGVELTSIFKNRDYKIYSNIVTTKMETKAKRMLLIFGVAHIGSLKNIIRDDEEFKIIEASKYVK